MNRPKHSLLLIFWKKYILLRTRFSEIAKNHSYNLIFLQDFKDVFNFSYVNTIRFNYVLNTW